MKKWMLTVLAGGVAGMAIANLIALAVSWSIGAYLPCSPEMIEAYGLLPAVTIQTISSFVLGAVFAGANCLWQKPWSLTRQMVSVYGIYMLTYLGVAWLNFWMEHSWSAVLRFVLLFTVIFACIGFSIWKHIQKSIQEINQTIQ